MGNHGEVCLSEFIPPGPVHHEMKDELCLTGYGVACCSAATDEKVTGADSPVYPMTSACAGPLMQFTLHRDISLELYILVALELLFKFFLAGRFCIGGNNGYEPVVFFHDLKLFERLRRRQVLATCRY